MELILRGIVREYTGSDSSDSRAAERGRSTVPLMIDGHRHLLCLLNLELDEVRC